MDRVSFAPRDILKKKHSLEFINNDKHGSICVDFVPQVTIASLMPTKGYRMLKV